MNITTEIKQLSTALNDYVQSLPLTTDISGAQRQNLCDGLVCMAAMLFRTDRANHSVVGISATMLGAITVNINDPQLIDSLRASIISRVAS